MPAPASTNALTLGRPLGDVAEVQSLEDLTAIVANLVQAAKGAGWFSAARAGDVTYQMVYTRIVGADDVLYGGRPDDPVNPRVLAPSASGSATIIVADEGVAVGTRGTINFIGAGVTAVDNAGATRIDITIPGGGGGTTYTAGDGIAISGADVISVIGFEGIVVDGNGVSVELAADPGLEFDAAGAAGKLRAKAGANISRTSTGINWNHTGISGWNAADAEKFLKHNLGVLSWGAGDGAGSSTIHIFLATVNDATHVIGTDATFAFNSTTDLGIGTTPANGTASNVRGRAFIHGETFLIIGNSTPTYYAFKLSPNIAYFNVNDTDGVPLDASTFGLDNFTSILNTVPSTGTASNEPEWATSANPQYADNQVLTGILKDNGNWYPLTGGYNTATAIVTTQIGARSGTYTWGQGVATILKKTGFGTHSATGGKTGQTIFNTTDNVVGVGDVIQLKRVDGEWFVDVGDC